MTAFVLRNVSDLSLFFAHAFRVLKNGGRFVSLDMFPPGKSWFSTLYSLYFYRLVPWIGGLLAHDRGAYRYLAEIGREFSTAGTNYGAAPRVGLQGSTDKKVSQRGSLHACS